MKSLPPKQHGHDSVFTLPTHTDFVALQTLRKLKTMPEQVRPVGGSLGEAKTLMLPQPHPDT